MTRSQILLQGGRGTRLGQIFQGAYIHNGRGLPMDRLRIYGHFALVYVLGGPARMKLENAPMTLCGLGSLIFVHPDIPLSYGPQAGAKWSEFYVSFGGSLFDLWRRAGILDPLKPLRHLPAIRRWLPRLEAIADPALPNSESGMLQRICRLQQFLVDIFDETTCKPEGPLWLEAAQRQLVENPHHRLQKIARDLGLSYQTFRKEFARRIGQPPSQYRQQQLMDQARWLVADHRLSNKQIAEMLGFCDEFHFSRRFKEIIGQSPRDFRRCSNARGEASVGMPDAS